MLSLRLQQLRRRPGPLGKFSSIQGPSRRTGYLSQAMCQSYGTIILSTVESRTTSSNLGRWLAKLRSQERSGTLKRVPMNFGTRTLTNSHLLTCFRFGAAMFFALNGSSRFQSLPETASSTCTVMRQAVGVQKLILRMDIAWFDLCLVELGKAPLAG